MMSALPQPEDPFAPRIRILTTARAQIATLDGYSSERLEKYFSTIGLNVGQLHQVAVYQNERTTLSDLIQALTRVSQASAHALDILSHLELFEPEEPFAPEAHLRER